MQGKEKDYYDTAFWGLMNTKGMQEWKEFVGNRNVCKGILSY